MTRLGASSSTGDLDGCAGDRAVWLSEHVPDARLHLIDGADHISIIVGIDSCVDELLELAGLRLAASR